MRDKFGTVAKTVSSGHVRYDSCLIMITDKSISCDFSCETANNPRKDRDLAGVSPDSYNMSLVDKKAEPKYR